MTDPIKFPGWPEAFTPNMPGIGAGAADAASALQGGLTGGLDFMKNLWGGTPGPVPGMVVPTLDVDELEKRIKDLKAVQAWLEINVNMLNATIQGLEVQRSTIIAVQSLGGSFNTAAGNAADLFKAATTPLSAATPAAAADSATPQSSMPSGWPSMAFVMPPDFTVNTPDSDWGRPGGVAGSATPGDASADSGTLSPAWPPSATTAAVTPPRPAARASVAPSPEALATPSRARSKATRSAATAGTTTGSVPSAAIGASPAASTTAPDAVAAAGAGWLDFMQDQFGKIAAAAVAPAMSPSAARLAAPAAVKSRSTRAAGAGAGAAKGRLSSAPRATSASASAARKKPKG